MKKPKVVAVVGPTSSGKTSLSIEIAQKYCGEVISADSRQVYRELDIGTGKVTKEEMAGIPHHLLDIAEPEDIYTAKDFVRDATSAIAQIHKSDKVPVIAGGTFFYIDLLRGKMQAAPVEPNTDFRDTLAKYTTEELLELLRAKDEKRAEAVDPHNRRRLVRSLEIIETLGSVPEQKPVESPYEWLMLGLEVDKDNLREKFSVRLASWLEQGLLEEVHGMHERLSTERFLELGFEYTLMAEFLDEQITKDELFEKFVQKNWQYAKRQMTWLQRDDTIEWFKPSNTQEIFQRIDAFLASS